MNTKQNYDRDLKMWQKLKKWNDGEKSEFYS
jgi:hypothetical protein